MFLNYFGFEREIIPKLFLSAYGVASPENQRNKFRSLFYFHFISFTIFKEGHPSKMKLISKGPST